MCQVNGKLHVSNRLLFRFCFSLWALRRIFAAHYTHRYTLWQIKHLLQLLTVMALVPKS